MIRQVVAVNWGYIGDALPSFVTICFIPFSYSVAYGLIALVFYYLRRSPSGAELTSPFYRGIFVYTVINSLIWIVMFVNLSLGSTTARSTGPGSLRGESHGFSGSSPKANTGQRNDFISRKMARMYDRSSVNLRPSPRKSHLKTVSRLPRYQCPLALHFCRAHIPDLKSTKLYCVVTMVSHQKVASIAGTQVAAHITNMISQVLWPHLSRRRISSLLHAPIKHTTSAQCLRLV